MVFTLQEEREKNHEWSSEKNKIFININFFVIFKCYFPEELIALTVLHWIRTRYLRITKP